MSIYKDIQQSRLLSRKAKDTARATFLATVLGDVQRRAEKEGCKDHPTDEVTTLELKAYVKRYQTESELRGLTPEQAVECVIVEGFLPKAASMTEMLEVVVYINPQSMKDTKEVMAALRATFDNFDGALASKLIKEHIGGS